MDLGLAIRIAKRLGLTLAYATVCGVFVGLLGPFGNFQHGSVVTRLVYWTGMAWAAGLMLTTALAAAERLTPRRMPAWLGALAAIAIATAPIAVLSRFAAVAVWPVLRQMLGPGDWYLQSLVLSLPFGMAFWWATSGRKPRIIADLAGSAASGSALRAAICLQMEDHYVRVHTAKGSHLVLMRLSDAIARTGQEGLQVHRSWWVARRAVEATVVDGRNFRLRLTGGLEAPVARTAVARVREAGLLAD